LQCKPAQLLENREIRSKIYVAHRKELFKPIVQNSVEKMSDSKKKTCSVLNRGINNNISYFEECKKVYMQESLQKIGMKEQ